MHPCWCVSICVGLILGDPCSSSTGVGHAVLFVLLTPVSWCVAVVVVHTYVRQFTQLWSLRHRWLWSRLHFKAVCILGSPSCATFSLVGLLQAGCWVGDTAGCSAAAAVAATAGWSNLTTASLSWPRMLYARRQLTHWCVPLPAGGTGKGTLCFRLVSCPCFATSSHCRGTWFFKGKSGWAVKCIVCAMLAIG
jgi:hypothetical protein